MNEHTDWSQLGRFFQIVFILMVAGTILVLAVQALWIIWVVIFHTAPPLSGVLHG